MNELFDLRPTNKEVAFGIIFVFLLLVFSFVAGYFLGIDRAKVPDNGNGTQPIGNELGQAGTDIQHAKDGISEAQHTADDIAITVDYLKGTADTSSDIIKQCKRIVEEVRSRGKADKVTH